MASHPILRFAPSPNGWLHFGHAYSALFTDHAAKSLGGVMLLRIEDIDIARCKPEFDAAIFKDLNWLGLTWPEPVMRQSERSLVYEEAAARLRGENLLYPCFCSRREIAAAGAGADPDGVPLYPGTCRHLPRAVADERLAHGQQASWRLKMDLALGAIGGGPPIDEVAVTDTAILPGKQTRRLAEPMRWGDVIVVRKDISTSYHLSVVIDDAAQGVTHVTRGMDLYYSTDIQVVLQHLLGLNSPIYAHHRLITDDLDQKLGKSKKSRPLYLMREEGWTPEMVRERLGFV